MECRLVNPARLESFGSCCERGPFALRSFAGSLVHPTIDTRHFADHSLVTSAATRTNTTKRKRGDRVMRLSVWDIFTRSGVLRLGQPRSGRVRVSNEKSQPRQLHPSHE